MKISLIKRFFWQCERREPLLQVVTTSAIKSHQIFLRSAKQNTLIIKSQIHLSSLSSSFNTCMLCSYGLDCLIGSDRSDDHVKLQQLFWQSFYSEMPFLMSTSLQCIGCFSRSPALVTSSSLQDKTP